MFDKAKQPAAYASGNSPSSKPTAESTNEVSNGLGNMFELLQIDEPSPNALGSAPAQAIKAVTFELEVTHDEKSFAIWCLLQDYRELRLELKSLWLDYKNGKVSFDNVSMLTSHGIGFVFYAQREFENQHPDLNSYPSIIEHVGLHVAQTFDEVFICPQDSKRPPPISKERVGADEIAELFCPRASLVLKGFIDVLSRKIGKTSVFPKFQEPMQVAEAFLRVHPLGVLLLSLMPQLAAASRKKAASPITEDPFLNVLHLLADHPHTRPPIWILQAIQIHMDIFDIVGPNVEREILQFPRSLAINLERMGAIHEYLIYRSSGAIRDALLKDCVEFEESCMQLAKDPYYHTDLKGATSKSLAKKAYSIYEAFPAIPGQIIKAVAVGVHYRGITCCDVGRIVLSAAYLYRAAIKIGAITRPWADMEFVIGIQSRSRPYVLETEADDGLASMARAFGVALGVNASAYRRGQRPKLPQNAAIEREARRMAVDYPLETEYKDGNNVSVPDSKTSLVRLGIQCLERLQKAGRGSTRLVEVYQQYKKTVKLTPTHLLLSMKEQFNVDEMDLNFDYFGFFNTCLAMIGEALTQFESHMPAQIVSVRGITTEYVPAYVTVHTMLWDAADRATSNSSSEQSLLFRAKAIIEEVIEQKGDKCVKLAQEKMDSLRRPAAAQSDKADESDHRNESDDADFLKNLFGTSTKETRGPGMSCRSTTEVEARINMRRAQEIAKYCPGESSSSQLVDAVFKSEQAGQSASNDSVSADGGGPKLHMAIRSLGQLENMHSRDSNLEKVYQEYKSNGRVTLVQLLSTMEKVYSHDEIDLKFDYIGFYMTCEKILQEIFESCGSALEALYQRHPFDQGYAYETVYAILCDAARPCKDPQASERSMMQKAGAVMEQYIAADGSRFSKLAREQTSGQLLHRPASTSTESKPEVNDFLELLRVMGLWEEESDASRGTFYNSRELSEARIAAHTHMVQMFQDPIGYDTNAAIEAFAKFMELNCSQMSAEERATFDKRYERVCRKLGFPPTVEELFKNKT